MTHIYDLINCTYTSTLYLRKAEIATGFHALTYMQHN